MFENLTRISKCGSILYTGLDAIIAELFPPVATDNTTVDYTVLDGSGDIDWLDLYTALSQTAEDAIIEVGISIKWSFIFILT